MLKLNEHNINQYLNEMINDNEHLKNLAREIGNINASARNSMLENGIPDISFDHFKKKMELFFHKVLKEQAR